jgi:predicted transcriptional regulator of viral defense system
MRFHEFRQAMRDYPVFTLQDARALEPSFDRRRLVEWQRRGQVVKLAKAHYAFADVKRDERFLYIASSRLYAPSYVSFETALAHYGLIPETVHVVVCATTRKTAQFDTPVGRFRYHTIAPQRFFGYRAEPGPWAIAEVEKALLDYFYIHTDIATPRDFESLRFDVETLREVLNRDRLTRFTQRSTQRRLTSRVHLFLEWLDHA